MTFSVVARSPDGSQLGVAVASKFLAAGAVVPSARAGTGAIASQSFANLRYVPDGFALLDEGVPAEEVLRRLTADDDQAASRQVGLVGTTGPGATFTGDACLSWAGGAAGDGWAVQGNCLAGPQVVAAMQQAFLAADGSLSRRLLAGLRAGDTAGGDRRGKQSAALYVVAHGGGYEGGNDVLVDLRVDDAPEPVQELTRLLDLHDLYFGKADPDTLLPLEGEVAEEVRGRLSRLGYTGRDLDEVLFAWEGWENFEERHVEGRIDPVVLAHLRALSP